jgi:hypothetical protein
LLLESVRTKYSSSRLPVNRLALGAPPWSSCTDVISLSKFFKILSYGRIVLASFAEFLAFN